jgi:hypothetical protein
MAETKEGPTVEGENDQAREFYQRHYSTEGHANTEVLRVAVEKPLLIHSAREVMAIYEDTVFHPEGAMSKYRLEDVISTLSDRESVQSLNFQNLTDLSVVRADTYKDTTGEATFNYPGFEYKRETVIREVPRRKIKDAKGDVVGMEVEDQLVEIMLVGSDTQRQELAVTLNQIRAEMMSRQDLVEMLRWVWGQTENLEGLVEFYYKNSLTAEAMNRLCNAEGRKDSIMGTEGGVKYREGNEFGDATSVALKCFEIAALSENVEELERLLKRPGIKELFNVTDQEIDDLFLKPENRGGRAINTVLKTWIGEPWRWKKSADPRVDYKKLKDDLIEEGKEDEWKKIEATTRLTKDDVSRDVEENERNMGYRGLLTERGNILVEAEEWQDIEFVWQQVERFIGGGDKSPIFAHHDARDVRFIAWEHLRITGMASDLGKQRYEDGFHHDMGVMTSCDRVKVLFPEVFRYIYAYLKPETRDFGPEGSLGKYPERFTVHYFKNWNLKTEEEEKGGKGKFGERTFQEMRWGYRKDGEGPEEPYYRLGELPWKRLPPKAYNVAALGAYIAGRKEKGLYQWAMRTDWEKEGGLRAFKEASFWHQMAKHMGIAMSAQVVLDGKFRGFYNGVREHDKQVKKGLVKERVREYKKKYILAFWDGLRSLPQWKEWLASRPDEIRGKTSGDTISVPSIWVVKNRISKIGILTPEEARSLPETPFNQDFLK